MRKVYRVFSVIVLVFVIAQFYLATFGAFKRPFDEDAMALHAMNGLMIIPILSILLTILAALARAPGKLILLSLAPLGIVLLQFSLFFLAGATGSSEERTNVAGQVVLGFHALIGLLLLYTAIQLVRRASLHAAAGQRVEQATVEPAVTT